MPPKLLVSLDHGIKRIVFNRPERRNSIDLEMADALRDAMEMSAEDGTRVVVLTGIRDAFCAGADLSAVRDTASPHSFDVAEWLRRTTNPTILAMRTLPAPVIARVHGPAVGIGCNYVLACDLVIASEQATFGQAFVKIGLMPDGGSTFFLPRLVGHQKAFELMALGEALNADEARSLGLVNRVVPLAALDGAVDALAARLARGPRLALAKIKAGLNHGESSDLSSALDFEASGQGECFGSTDFAEGVRAFLEKRPAKFG